MTALSHVAGLTEAQRTWVANPNPWLPMTGVADVQHLGKFAEEGGEATAAASRCIIQGIDEREPSTGEVNRRWLEKEIADVLANAELVIEHFKLDGCFIAERIRFKKEYLHRWHNGGSAHQETQL
jgi:hypothetical protein